MIHAFLDKSSLGRLTIGQDLSVAVILDCTLAPLIDGWTYPAFQLVVSFVLGRQFGEETLAESFSATPTFSYGTEFS